MMQFEMIALQSPPACGSVSEYLFSDVSSTTFSVFFPRVLQLWDHWCSFARFWFILSLFLRALDSSIKIFHPVCSPPSCCLCSPKVMLPWELSCPPSGDSNHLFNSSWPWVPSLQLLRWCREDSPSRGASPGSFLPPSSRGHPWLASSSRLPSCQHKLFCLYKQPCFKVPLLL